MARVETIHTNSPTVFVLSKCIAIYGVFLFINVYMPYEDGDERTDDFCEQLSVIDYLMSQNTNCHIIIGGDFNVGILEKLAAYKIAFRFL